MSREISNARVHDDYHSSSSRSKKQHDLSISSRWKSRKDFARIAYTIWCSNRADVAQLLYFDPVPNFGAFSQCYAGQTIKHV